MGAVAAVGVLGFVKLPPHVRHTRDLDNIASRLAGVDPS